MPRASLAREGCMWRSLVPRTAQPDHAVHHSAEIAAALEARVAHPSPGAADRTGRVVFHAPGAGTWTVDLAGGRARVRSGRRRQATSTIESDPETMLEVITGRLAGIEAFLAGELFMRGNIAFALELDALLPPPTRDRRTPRAAFVRAAGIRTFHLESGPVGAPPVVLLHGLRATSASFLPMQWDLARDHRVHAIDLPGFGESDKPIRPLHPAFFAEWLTAWLDAVGLARVHVIGNSMGGRIALEMGLRSPARVDRLVLLAPSLAWRRYRAAARLVRLLRPELALLPMRVLHQLVVSGLRTMFAVPERVPEAAMNAAADEFVRTFATPRGRIAFFHALREIYLEDPWGRRGFWDRLPALAPPALFIFGEKDRLVPRAFLRHVRAALPSAEWELFENCGHVPQFEMPERTNERVRAFLGASRRAS